MPDLAWQRALYLAKRYEAHRVIKANLDTVLDLLCESDVNSSLENNEKYADFLNSIRSTLEGA